MSFRGVVYCMSHFKRFSKINITKKKAKEITQCLMYLLCFYVYIFCIYSTVAVVYISAILFFVVE